SSNCPHWVETLRAHPGTVSYASATEQTEGIAQIFQALDSCLIATVQQKTQCLQQCCRTQVLIRVPPPGRALGRAASTQNALVQPIQFRTLLRRLPAFDRRRCVTIDQPGLDTLIL